MFPIQLPPLRERKDDMPLLVRYLALRYGARLAKRIPAVSPETMDALQAYPWPGNIRELENVIERAKILSEGAELDVRGSLPSSGGGGAGAGVRTLEDIQREYSRLVLEQTGGGSAVMEDAELLGMKPTTLEARMRKLGIKRTG